MEKPTWLGAFGNKMDRRKSDSLKLHSALAAIFVFPRPLVSRPAQAHEKEVVFFFSGLRFAAAFEQGNIDLGS